MQQLDDAERAIFHTQSPQEESESRQILFRDFGDPMANFTAQLQASTASLVPVSLTTTALS
jgi:hypothetical protein